MVFSVIWQTGLEPADLFLIETNDTVKSLTFASRGGTLRILISGKGGSGRICDRIQGFKNNG